MQPYLLALAALVVGLAAGRWTGGWRPSRGGVDLSLSIPPELDRRIRDEASLLEVSREQRVLDLLEYGIAPAPNLEPGFVPERLAELKRFLDEIPCLEVLSVSEPDEKLWWIKMKIDVASPIAWHVVQGLGYVFNELSLTDRLPTVFKPVSPPPYLNGGPAEFLYWVVEATIPFFDPEAALSYLKGRLPDPVTGQAAWLEIDGDGDADDEELDP